MENKSNSLEKKVIAQRLFVALVIVGACLTFILYLFGILAFPLLENLKVKIIISSVLISSILIYLFAKYAYYFKSGDSIQFDWKTFIIFSFIFEIIGYWWGDTIFGYILQFFAFISLIIGLTFLYRAE